MAARSATVDSVVAIVTKTLGIEDRAGSFGEQTRLLGSLPELDSLAVVEIANELEEAFGFRIDEAEFTAEVFETIGSLAEFVETSAGLDDEG